MDVLKQIDKLREARGWTVYRLAEQSGLSAKSIYNWYKRGSVPNVANLEKICEGFGISLSQFFAEGNLVEVDDELNQLFTDWMCLTDEQRELIKQTIKLLKN